MSVDDDGRNALVQLTNEVELNKFQEQLTIRKHVQEKQSHYNELSNPRTTLKTWKYYYECGFNLMIFGVGSKRNLINTFVSTFIEDPKLVINGFHSGVTIKSIITPLSKFVQKVTGTRIPNAMHDAIEELKRILNKLPEDIGFEKVCIVIHSMDAGALKNEDW